MNLFVTSTKKMIEQYGSNVTYRSVSEPTYDFDTGRATATSSDKTFKAYKRHVVANQYNYPNLVGKDVAEFYVYAASFDSKPKINDKIVQDGETYTVQRYGEHGAYGQVILYKLLCVKT